MTEEAIIKMGLDAAGVAAGLRSIQAQFKGFGESIGHLFKHVGDHLMGSLGIAGGMMAIERALKRVQDIQRMSESLGVSTGFAQDIRNVGVVAGISGEAIEKMMGKFIKGLPVGSDVEQQFYKIADKIKGIEDPSERARVAVDAFGKSGVKMVAVLEKGSQALREEAAQFAKFNDAEIEALEKAKTSLEQFENFFTVWVGKIVYGYELIGTAVGHMAARSQENLNIFQRVYRALQDTGADIDAVGAARGAAFAQNKLGEALARRKAEDDRVNTAMDALYHKQEEKRFKAGTSEEKLDILERKKLALQIGQSMTEDEAEFYDYAVKILDIEEKIDAVKKKQTAEIEKQQKAAERAAQKYEHALERAEDASWKIAEAKHARLEFSLEDLANAGQRMVTTGVGGGREFWQDAPGAAQARQVMELERMAKWDALHGNTDLARSEDERAQSLYKALEKANPFLKRDPMEKLVEAADKQINALNELVDCVDNGVMTVRGEEE